MSNLVPFTAALASPFEVLLEDQTLHPHAVQFYESESFLFESVARFLAAGLQSGDRVVVIATPQHRRAFVEALPAPDVDRAIADGRLVLLDARDALAKFMVGEMPDEQLFHDFVGRAIAQSAAEGPVRVRAFGEMVDLLWREGNSRAAVRLEELWTAAVQAHPLRLLCAYVMGNFYKEAETARFMDICRTHSLVIPSERFTRLDDAAARLREISVLQQRARILETEIEHREQLEKALRDALRERSRISEELRLSLKRETEARELAEAHDAYKEMFVGILGHELRNPLHTVLTTARLMKMRRELGGEAERRLDRIVSSSERMERMIGQLLDVTRARLSDGIALDRSRPHDLLPIVSRIVDEIRVANPDRRIDVRCQDACAAYLDGDRFEQVLSNLLSNAISYGDPEQPITVVLAARAGAACLSVHNLGIPIEPALIPVLFNPFERGPRRESRGGLGLGLYIAERIVSAHGGKLEVASSREDGTRFEVVIPTGPPPAAPV